jgi:hypothetical protein
MATRNLRIKLKYQGDGVFCATVNVPKQGVDRTDRVKWKVDQPEPAEFPRTAVVAVDFAPDKDPLIDGALGHHRGQRGNDHKIEGRVGFVEDGDYPYMVSWVSEDGLITHMVDPELVVEGGPGNIAEVKRARKAAKAKKAAKKTKKTKKTKKAAKKSAAAGRKKAAKKSAKKAKRSTKRKAKKR